MFQQSRFARREFARTISRVAYRLEEARRVDLRAPIAQLNHSLREYASIPPRVPTYRFPARELKGIRPVPDEAVGAASGAVSHRGLRV